MQISIKSTGLELTPAISDYVDKKVSSIEKYLDDSISDVVAQVEVARSTTHHKSGNIFRAEIHVVGSKGFDLYADSTQEDLYAAIDVVRDEIIRSVVQSKDKQVTLTRRGAEIVKYMMKGIGGQTSRIRHFGSRGFEHIKKLRNFKRRK